MTKPEIKMPIRTARLADALTTAIVVLDAQDKLLYINSAGEQFWDVSYGVLLKQGFAPFFEQNPILAKAVAEARLTEQVVTLREAELVSIHGQTHIADCAITPSPDISGADILLELADIERHMRITRDAQLHAMQISTRQLVRGLAHELKNPLGGLQGAAQLLERELPNADLREFTQIILNESSRLKNLIDRMLGPNNRPQMQRINIHEPLEQVRRLLSIEAEETLLQEPLQWHFDFDPSIPDVLADRDQLIQVLLNLSRNALQAMSENDTNNPTLRFKTRVLRRFTIHQTLHRLVLRIDVENNGPPVPDTLVESLFLPMVSGRAHGSGLGLSIAQTIAEQHQGLIEFKQKPGAVRFSLILPLSQSLPGQDTQGQHHQETPP
ncbi:nitrogen regulation protein NR(II) [Halothiobacillus neapolitanus]|uniref:histidine kinase n=1 Tax=Halothiobacillus neapolitanus (strain ATCC 23641 / DSM 15147 / CIP 104769 / NCIMB 8539 / c2) TaxID=555778 RepID=D0KXA6_HALNC|nr:nitrogen regulation protein NR(II) [Halothiobacillus neapolitanus]ACX95120.1 signal transduction histidine kinase, nitrogen specific, NtrB [Halothiobacillus neapolitanus c2]